jgi:hypothetical protein
MPMHNHFLGFKSLKQMMLIVTGLQYKGPAAFNALLSIEVAMLTLVATAIEQWLWSPFYSLVIYFIVLTADFVSGIYVGMRVRKEGFLTQKGQRLPVILVCHLVLLGVFYNLGRINEDLGVGGIDAVIFEGVARAFYFYVISINLMSFIKNMVLLGYLKGAIADFFQRYIDKQKNPPTDVDG